MFNRYKEPVVIFIDYQEINELIARFFGLDKYSLVPDMYNNDSSWQNDTIHDFEIGPDTPDNQRPDFLNEALAKKKVEFDWELDAVMNAIAEQPGSDLEPGRYIIEVGW